MTKPIEGQVEIAQTEKLGLGDLVLAVLLAACTWVALSIWPLPGTCPAEWQQTAVAASIRPAVHVVGNYAAFIGQFFFKGLGIAGGEHALDLVARTFLALIAAGLFFLVRELLGFIMQTRPQFSRRRTLVMRLSAVLSVIAFVFMDPVWAAGQSFCEANVLMFLTVAALVSYFVFLRKGRLAAAYLSSLLLGLLAADTCAGFVLPAIFIALALFVMRVVPSLESPLFQPSSFEIGKWYMTFLFFFGLVAGILVNCVTFVLHSGLGAVGESLGSLPLQYIVDYWCAFVDIASPASWLLWIGVCLAPFLVTWIRLPNSADEDQFLSYGTGMVFFFCGAVAFTQCAALPALWFWTYFPIDSRYFHMLGGLCCVLTLAGAVTTLGVDSLCRNHQKLAKKLFGLEDDEFEMAGVSRATTTVRRVGIILVPLVLIVGVVVGRFIGTTRLMLDLVNDAVAEIVTEAKGAKYLFTDGLLDVAVELEAARRGEPLRCLTLMGGSTVMDSHLRTRGMADPEDLLSFRYDTGMGLRSWIRDKPVRLAAAAVQMGFDLWKRDGKALPPMGGMLSRPTGFASEDERQRGICAAHALAERIHRIRWRRTGLRACSDPALKRAFIAVQWRLARMCLYRGESEDLAGQADVAIEEVNRAKALNDSNETYKKLVEDMDRRNAQILQKLTPREGLQLALVRADFTLGKVYAETILGADPENPDANFAMGMHYLAKRQLSRAETYLKRCLIRKPNEAAVYNNLAMVQIELGKFDAAEANVAKALKILPDSAAIRDTQKAIAAARAKRKK